MIAVAPALVRAARATTELDRVGDSRVGARAAARRSLESPADRACWHMAGWHPAVWWLERQLRIEREVACDEMAVSLTGNRQNATRPASTAMAMLLPVRHRPGLGGRSVFVAHAEDTHPADSVDEYVGEREWSATRVVVVVVALAVFALGLTRVRLVARAMPHAGGGRRSTAHRRPPDAVGRRSRLPCRILTSIEDAASPTPSRGARRPRPKPVPQLPPRRR